MRKKSLEPPKISILAQERDVYNALVLKHKIEVQVTPFYTRFINPSNRKTVIFVLPSPQHFKYKIAKINQIL